MEPARVAGVADPDYEAIRRIMQEARVRLTVPDRARLAVGLVGHLATRLSRAQMRSLLEQMHEEAERVRQVPPRERHLHLERGGEERWLRG